MEKKEVTCHTEYGTITFKGNLVPRFKATLESYHEGLNEFTLINERSHWATLRIQLPAVHAALNCLTDHKGLGNKPKITITIDE
jgi:hypothetical protein